MEQGLIRLLKAEEIECRISTINEKGLSLLLYKDARVDQRILDETFGAFGWKRSHQCIDGNLYCTVEILDRESGQWVAKQDVGTTGYTEKEKSQASDSFKRACFNWGIGRELYSAPFIWIPAARAGIWQKGDRYFSNERFTVSAIAYNDNREIASLEIKDSHGQTVYSLGQGRNARDEQQKEEKTVRKAPDGQSVQNVQAVQSRQEKQDNGKRTVSGRNAAQSRGSSAGKKLELILLTELNRTGVPLEEVLKRYKITDISQMTPEIYEKAISALRQTKPKKAGNAA